MFLLILELEVVAALSMGMLVSAAAATPELAIGIGIPVTIISFIFAGFYSKLLYIVFLCSKVFFLHFSSLCVCVFVFDWAGLLKVYI